MDFRKIEKKFEKHINTSVPFYDVGHNIILELSSFFLMNNSSCLDIGCSTGLLLNRIKQKLSHRKISFIGLDTEKGMIKESKKKK